MYVPELSASLHSKSKSQRLDFATIYEANDAANESQLD